LNVAHRKPRTRYGWSLHDRANECYRRMYNQAQEATSVANKSPAAAWEDSHVVSPVEDALSAFGKSSNGAG
jgi:hypothetical protein